MTNQIHLQRELTDTEAERFIRKVIERSARKQIAAELPEDVQTIGSLRELLLDEEYQTHFGVTPEIIDAVIANREYADPVAIAEIPARIRQKRLTNEQLQRRYDSSRRRKAKQFVKENLLRTAKAIPRDEDSLKETVTIDGVSYSFSKVTIYEWPSPADSTHYTHPYIPTILAVPSENKNEIRFYFPSYTFWPDICLEFGSTLKTIFGVGTFMEKNTRYSLYDYGPKNRQYINGTSTPIPFIDHLLRAEFEENPYNNQQGQENSRELLKIMRNLPFALQKATQKRLERQDETRHLLEDKLSKVGNYQIDG